MEKQREDFIISLINENKIKDIDEITEKGKARAFEKGLTNCFALIFAEGYAIGYVEGRINILGNLTEMGILTTAEAAQRAGMAVEDFEKLRNMKTYEAAEQQV